MTPDLQGTLLVFVLALGTALATGLGAIPFAFVRSVSRRVTAVTNVLAAGLMLGASAGLLAEGIEWSDGAGGWQTASGALLGVIFVVVSFRYLQSHEIDFGGVGGKRAREMALMVLVMTAHSVAEGVAVGGALAGEIRLGAVVTIAIAVHNIPEGIAISAVLRARGQSVWRCAVWSVVSSLPQPLLAVPAFLFVGIVGAALPWAVGFAAGAMVVMCFLELFPEAYDCERRDPWVAVFGAASVIAMFLFQRAM
jgi:ZIP family zinc transporter